MNNTQKLINEIIWLKDIEAWIDIMIDYNTGPIYYIAVKKSGMGFEIHAEALSNQFDIALLEIVHQLKKQANKRKVKSLEWLHSLSEQEKYNDKRYKT